MGNIVQLSKFDFKVGGYIDVPSAGGCALPGLRNAGQRIDAKSAHGDRTDTDQTAQAFGSFITGPHMGLRTQTRTDAEWPSQAPGPIIIGD